MAGDAHLVELLREIDHERYLTALYAPPEKRAALTALYAFNAEIAAIRDKIHEPMAGEIRLQWWRDALVAGAGMHTGNPVADALHDVIETHQLPRGAFERLLAARIFDLYDDPMPDTASLEGYCGETASSVIQLAALILDRDRASQWSDAAGHAGCAQAMTGLLRLLPLHRARGQCFLPAELLAAAGTSRDELIAGQARDALSRAVMAMAMLAREHFDAFANQAKGMPQSIRPAFLPLVPVPAYLSAFAARPERALDRVVEISAPRVQLLTVYRALRGWR
ncbi:MAG: phytoene/squalene synthase family protein [Rhizobiaceae bacterium]